jgi:co-chaperonin GroES (HSP10)
MEIKPFGKNILVKPIEKKQILVSSQPSLCEYGTVIAIGDEVTKIKVGDTIGYTVWGVNSLEIENEKHYFIPESGEFILGVLLS